MRVFAGPCVIENEVQALHVARHLAGVAARAGVEIVYKSSFDKANRSSPLSPRGPGLERGLAILAEVKATHAEVTALRGAEADRAKAGRDRDAQVAAALDALATEVQTRAGKAQVLKLKSLLLSHIQGA